MKVSVLAAGFVAAVVTSILSVPVFGHGSVTPQSFDTPGLPDLGKDWKKTNPFRDGKDKATAIEIGSHGYLANCAACHGLELDAGSMAPDLHGFPTGTEGDDIYADKVVNGVHRNGMTKMPSYFPIVSQAGLWAIRTYIESKHQDN